MSDYINITAAALIGILVPTCAGWLWNKVKSELESGNNTLLQKIQEIQLEQASMRAEHTALRTDVLEQGKAIAYLQGADSQRAQTATAALEAARLLLHPTEKQIPNPRITEGGYA